MPNQKKRNDPASACRVCAESEPENIVTMSERNGWFDLFQYCFGLSLSNEDQPLTLCEPCANKIKDFTSFKAQCICSDSLWRPANNQSFKDNTQESSANKPSEEKNKVQNDETDIYNVSDDSDFYWDEVKNETESETKPKKKQKIEKLEDKINLNDVQPENVAILRSGKIFTIRKPYIKPVYPRSTNTNRNNNDAFTKSLKKLSHESKRDLEDGKDLCGICTFTSKDNNVMKKHLDEHWANKDLQCRLCDYVGKDQAGIFAHRNIHCKFESGLRCHYCPKKVHMKTLRGMEFHYRVAHLHRAGGLCSQPECNVTFRSWRAWQRHEKAHSHSGFICDLCGQKYKYRKSIVDHLKFHMNPPNPHICHYCGRSFLRLRGLHSHIKNIHTASKSVRCSHCSRIFKNQSRLEYHQKRIAREKKWKCQLCPAAFPVLCFLKEHLKVHSDERPFSCDVCGASFKAKCRLVIHLRGHTGERPYKCTHCDSSFPSSNQLKSHNILHTGIKPYKCVRCDKMFREKRMLIKHSEVCQKTLEQ